MKEIDLRGLVRDAVARHLGATPPFNPLASGPSVQPRAVTPSLAQGVYVALVNPTDDCLIEPSVRCNHCGYCQTHGY